MKLSAQSYVCHHFNNLLLVLLLEIDYSKLHETFKNMELLPTSRGSLKLGGDIFIHILN